MMDDQLTNDALDLIRTERRWQKTRWTTEHDAGHMPLEWAALIAKYQGRMADAALEGNDTDAFANASKAAAVAVAFMEQFLSRSR
jgi:hypothetical protein